MGDGWDVLQPIDRVLLEDYGGRAPPILSAVIRVRGAVSREWALRNFIEPVIAHPRFRSVPDAGRGRFVLLPDDKFHPNDHLTVADGPLTGAEYNRVLSTKLPYDKPLWHLYIYNYTGLHDDDFHSQLYFRVHHSIGDGGALVRFFLQGVFRVVRNDSKSDTPPLILPARRDLDPALVSAGAQPGHFEQLTRLIRDTYSYTIGILIPDVPNALNTRGICGAKSVAFARDRRVSQLRAASRRVGITINDLLLSALSSAVAALYPGDSMNVAVPKFRPAAGKGSELHNEAILYIMRLPLYADVTRVTAACVRLMLDRKASMRAALCLMVVKLLGYLPESVCTYLWGKLTRRASIAFTNVPGPPTKMACGDREIEEVQVIASGLGRCGTILTAFSYLDILRVNLSADDAIMKNPEKFMREFDRQLDRLLLWIDQTAGK